MADQSNNPFFASYKTIQGVVCGVYEIRCSANGKIYIGSSVHIKFRWRWHWYALSKGIHHCEHLQRCWNKFGVFAFSFRILEVVTAKDARELWVYENRHLLAAGDTAKLMNTGSTAGAAMLGRRHSDISKQKISAGNRGKFVSAESRARMRAAQKGRKPHKGWHHSTDTKSRMSAANMGSPGGMLGKRHSDEARKRMSVKNLLRDNATRVRGRMHGRARAICVDGVVYETLTSAARHFLVSRTKITNWLKSGRAQFATA